MMKLLIPLMSVMLCAATAATAAGDLPDGLRDKVQAIPSVVSAHVVL